MEKEKASPLHTRERYFTFVDSKNQESEIITISEVLDPSYGMYVWPCAPVLAQYIWFHRRLTSGKIVLELGAGTALPGILAARCGAHVTLSDNHTYNQCLENTRKTCRLNCLPSIPVLGLTWGMFQPELLKMGRVDIILASDCFYDTKDFEDVIVTVSFLLKRNPGSEFWCTYQERSSNRTIEHLLSKWQLQCLHVPLSTFDADSPNIAGSHLPGNHTIHMLVVSTTGTDCDRL